MITSLIEASLAATAMLSPSASASSDRGGYRDTLELADWFAESYRSAAASNAMDLRPEPRIQIEIAPNATSETSFVVGGNSSAVNLSFTVGRQKDHYRSLQINNWVWDATSMSRAKHAPMKLADPIDVLAAKWSKLAANIHNWSDLSDNWDGDEGIPLPHNVSRIARDFAERARNARLPAPDVYLTGDGEVGFKWRKADLFATAAFLSDGHIVVYSEISTGPVYKLDTEYGPDLDFAPLFDMISQFSA